MAEDETKSEEQRDASPLDFHLTSDSSTTGADLQYHLTILQRVVNFHHLILESRGAEATAITTSSFLQNHHSLNPYASIKTSPNRIGCETCSRQFDSWPAVWQHMDPLGHWGCTTCNDAFETESIAEEHIQLAHCPPQFESEACNASFAT
ncbi:hypothetical protein K458DRAFT_429380 [Lentithecium fluviatile CBS 122367]|uniref:C2H2-type domain-containing protein n=1 Tax=Lentithecium fluviatile CBS 122367 TaxID=1168545 RepID=A0A6G1JB80_9PLEO|nr:hypothetical protein K458DRAFT_429380 [Lentithecium fluviatile CBS 122367]